MNTILYQKDTKKSRENETCDNYQNHFISRVIYNSDSGLYFILENYLGTGSDKTIDVFVTQNKNNFVFYTDYISFDAVKIDEIKVGVLKEFDALLDKLVERFTEKFESKVKNEQQAYDEIMAKIEEILRKNFFNYNEELKKIGEVIALKYKTKSWWKK